MYPCLWVEQLLADRGKKPWVSTPSLPLCAPWKDYSDCISPKWCNDRNLLIKWTLLHVNHNDDDTMITLTDTQQLFGIIKYYKHYDQVSFCLFWKMITSLKCFAGTPPWDTKIPHFLKRVSYGPHETPNPSWVPEARSVMLGKPQNVPAWTVSWLLLGFSLVVMTMTMRVTMRMARSV